MPAPARLYSSAPERTLPTDPVARADIEHVLERGYMILNDVFTKGEAEAAKAEMRRLSGNAPLKGRNSFEGLNTNRIYSLLNKTRVFDKFCILPRVLALNDYFLEPAYQISVMHTIQINPGEAPQELHHDDGFIQIARPRPPMGTAIIVALDDFTATNGATVVVPGSHTWDSDRKATREQTVPLTCSAGSVIYLIGTTWHGGGQNLSNTPRMSATVQYCQPYIRPFENSFLAVDPRRLDSIPARVVDLMGYKIQMPFTGYGASLSSFPHPLYCLIDENAIADKQGSKVDGLNPRDGARRLVKWLQAPLDRDPPAFAKL